MEGNKCGNVLWYSYWCTHRHADPHIEKKSIYIYIYNTDVNCVKDKKNQRFHHDQFGLYNYYRNYLKKVTYKCFVDFVGWVIIYLKIINKDIC